jgi:hypothetical protein
MKLCIKRSQFPPNKLIKILVVETVVGHKRQYQLCRIFVQLIRVEMLNAPLTKKTTKSLRKFCIVNLQLAHKRTGMIIMKNL